MLFDLPFIWAGIIAFAVLTYVILDGFDLGVGILFPFAKSEQDKDLMMNSIAPVWDGNETWLILGGGGLLAVFPLAYAIILPALYMPIITMLLALIFRGVAFEYRGRTKRWKPVWEVGFAAGSAIAAMMQGITLGALVQGITVVDRAYAGGWWDWLSPFTVLTGLSVVAGYALLGSTWLILKTEGALQQMMRDKAFMLGMITLAAIGTVSVLTPFQNPVYFQRWFNLPGSLYTMVVPLAMMALTWLLFSSLKAGHDSRPFIASLLIFVVSFIGVGISFYPNIVPPSVSIWEAAAPDSSLRFTLYGTLALVPLILGYTGYAYWVFRGKVNPDEGYH